MSCISCFVYETLFHIKIIGLDLNEHFIMRAFRIIIYDEKHFSVFESQGNFILV